MRILGTSLLPSKPTSGTTVIPLLNADEIFQAEQNLIQNTKSDENLYISQFSLPQIQETPSVGTIASNAQRQLLPLLEQQIQKKKVTAFIVADNAKLHQENHNEETINYLHQIGAFILPYPTHLVSINHTKFMANDRYAVVTSANISSHSADSPDDNAGFLLSGAAVHNGILHSFLPQWNVSMKEDKRGWAAHYPSPSVSSRYAFDEKVVWLNTAPKEENGKESDSIEIFDAYRKLIQRAASGPPSAYLYFEHFNLSNLALVRHLIYAHQVNPTLDIRFILDPNQYLEGVKASPYDTRVIAYNEIKKANIPLRFARILPHPHGSHDSQRFHNKFVVYNDEEIINGSGNLSNHSLNENHISLSQEDDVSLTALTTANLNGLFHYNKRRNREVDVLVRDKVSAIRLKEKFLDDWLYRSCENPEVACGEVFAHNNVNVYT